jgi:hypothetical protein
MAGGARLFAAVAGLVLIVGGGLFLSQSMQARSPVAKASQDTPRSRPTAKALYLASIAPEGGEPTVGPLHNWTLTVATADGAPVAGA